MDFNLYLMSITGLTDIYWLYNWTVKLLTPTMKWQINFEGTTRINTGVYSDKFILNSSSTRNHLVQILHVRLHLESCTGTMNFLNTLDFLQQQWHPTYKYWIVVIPTTIFWLSTNWDVYICFDVWVVATGCHIEILPMVIIIIIAGRRHCQTVLWYR